MARDLLDQFRRLYRVEPGALPEHYSEDLVIEQDRDVPGTGGTFHGHAGLLSLMAELAESYTDIVWRPDKVVELGEDRYLVLVTATGRGAQSGIPLTDKFAHSSSSTSAAASCGSTPTWAGTAATRRRARSARCGSPGGDHPSVSCTSTSTPPCRNRTRESPSRWPPPKAPACSMKPISSRSRL